MFGYYLHVQIKKVEMGWACGTYGEEAGHIQGFGGETWKKRPLDKTRHMWDNINPLKPELNPICYLLALLAHHLLHVSRIRVKSLTLR